MYIKEITDKELLELADSQQGLNRFYLYRELSKRASSNKEIKETLFRDIVDKDKLKMDLSPRGSIMKLSWIPVIEILLNSSNSIKKELKELINTWPDDELESLKLYLKNNPEELKYI